MKKEVEKPRNEIDSLSKEIKLRERLILSGFMNSLLPKKCEYCGCYDGIHRADCLFMRKYW